MTQTIDKSLWGGAETFDRLLADIRSRRDEFERQRHISPDIIERFREIGVYRAMVPAVYGGDEKTPRQFLEMVEAISSADGSAGWVASFGMSPAYLAALPEKTVTQIWRDSADIVFAGGVFPPQPAKRVDGGFRVTGRWRFASGSPAAELCGVGIIPEGEDKPLPRMAVMPREQVRIEETWDMVGMNGTGSHDLVVEDVFVPEDWTFIRGSTPSVDAPFFRYPSLSFASQVLSVTTLGMAREAIDVVTAMAHGRKSITGAPNLGEREYVQIEVARAEARLQASRAFFYQAVDQAWEAVLAGGEPSREQTSMLRLSTTHLTTECAAAIRACYEVSGMSGAESSNPLQRLVRDSMLCTQHAFMGAVTLKNAGAMLFGHDPLPGYL